MSFTEIEHEFLGGSIVERPKYEGVRENRVTGQPEPVKYSPCVMVYRGRDECRLSLSAVRALSELYASDSSFREFCDSS